MTVSKYALVLALGLTGSALLGGASAQQEPPPPPPPEPVGPPPINLSLSEAIQMSLKNNLDVKIAAKTPQIREQDIFLQEAFFDPNLGFSAQYQDNSRPAQNQFDIGTGGTVESVDSTGNTFTAGVFDRLRYGASYSADLFLSSTTSTSANAVFPTTYYMAFELAYNQSLLRNFGRDVNQTLIVLAQNNQEISRNQFHQEVLDTLKTTEDAYWELVFARQDLEVKRESLGLAQQLLKLNRIKVEVGTLPPIEITQAEAEEASREQGVIVAENVVKDAEDILRRVLNAAKSDGAWERPIAPTDEPAYVERPVDLTEELETAISNRPDLAQAKLEIQNAKTRLAFDKNQLKWDLNFRATYNLQGLAGDAPAQALFPIFCDDTGLDGDPATMDQGFGDGICQGGELANPSFPTGRPGENLTFLFSSAQNQTYLDALEFIKDGEFPSWSASLFLGIPIGNNAAQASFIGSRLAEEQAEISYEAARLNAEVQVRAAARAILTGKKRIDAAEKNVVLQRKKVEAEQKKFQNGMSTSFQVLEFQEDLTTALGQKNRALVDYRKSLTALELAKGTLDDYLKVAVQ